MNILNIDKKEIKYRIEIKKENKKEKFKQIYEGKDNSFLIDNLEKNTNYEIKLCSIYNDIISNYTQIYKIKTKNFEIDSLILSEIERGKEFLNKLYEWTGYKSMELLYRGTRDGSGANVFHNKCDNQGPTLCLIKNDKGNIFGGYASISWTDNGGCKYADGSFLFTLTNIHNTAPTKYSNMIYPQYAVYHSSNYGPTFGGGFDIYVSDNYFNNNDSYSRLGHSYSDSLGKGKSVFTGDANISNNRLIIKELEVFKLK